MGWKSIFNFSNKQNKKNSKTSDKQHTDNKKINLATLEEAIETIIKQFTLGQLDQLEQTNGIETLTFEKQLFCRYIGYDPKYTKSEIEQIMKSEIEKYKRIFELNKYKAANWLFTQVCVQFFEKKD